MGRVAHHGPAHAGRPQFLDIPIPDRHHHHHYSHSRGLSTGGTTTTIITATPRPLISPLQLPPRAESTRIQLQRQQQLEILPPLASANSFLPGIKTSAAFFASLRTNLSLHASPPLPSPLPTPPMRASSSYLAPPSPLSCAIDFSLDQPGASPLIDPFDGVPELTTVVAATDDDRMSALELAADSVAQMRQAANRSLIYHPLNVVIVFILLAFLSRSMHNRGYELSTIFTTSVGLILVSLLGCRMLTRDYIWAARGMDLDWLRDADVLITRFGDEIIGTVIIDWVSGESRTKKKKAWQGQIRAWTVRLKYRNKGVGTALLEETVKEAKRKSAESLEFADDHANAKRVLPALYNRKLDQQDLQARELLFDLYQTSPTRNKKKP